jgi:hypothetical protein
MTDTDPAAHANSVERIFPPRGGSLDGSDDQSMTRRQPP